MLVEYNEIVKLCVGVSKRLLFAGALFCRCSVRLVRVKIC